MNIEGSRWTPTSVYKLNYNGNNQFFIKREDLIPFSFGGNKARKAFLFFHEIDVGDYDTVVTYGSSSSNHCRVVANMAVSRGMQCVIISAEETSHPTCNSEMMRLFGAKIITCPVKIVAQTIEATLDELRCKGKRPYFIQGGGHGNLGTQAYVDCYTEIRDYEQRYHIYFDYIFHASGTGTTQAGLVCGQLIHQDERRIVGISIARKNPRGRQVVIDSIHEYLSDKEMDIPTDQIENVTEFVDTFTGDGYGHDSNEINETIRSMMTQYGIPLDSTYTGKAYTGMLKYIDQHGIQGKNILFIHTGGTPLFFDNLERGI